MKIVVIDGQGGSVGRMLIEKMLSRKLDAEIIAIGTNSIATANMLKAGIKLGATGENATIVNVRDADYIAGLWLLILFWERSRRTWLSQLDRVLQRRF